MLTRTQSHYGGGENWPLRGSLVQSVSEDGGATWSEWHSTGMSSMSSPASLIRLHDGRLLCTHASRSHPRSIYLTLSEDGGRTWNTARTSVLTSDLTNLDSCYPTTVQRPDGSLVSTWYANRFGRFYVTAALYQLEDLDALQ
jgi:Neuraminidase (sialidase)